jgi:hypothetical protein
MAKWATLSPVALEAVVTAEGPRSGPAQGSRGGVATGGRMGITGAGEETRIDRLDGDAWIPAHVPHLWARRLDRGQRLASIPARAGASRPSRQICFGRPSERRNPCCPGQKLCTVRFTADHNPAQARARGTHQE